MTSYSTSGDFCAIIQSECYIFIPDKSFNVTHLMNHIKNKISALSDPFPSHHYFHWKLSHTLGNTRNNNLVKEANTNGIVNDINGNKGEYFNFLP